MPRSPRHLSLVPATDLDPDNPEIELLAPPAAPCLLTLTLELCESEPRIWRRLTLPGDLTLDRVHTVLQAAMGWTDSHLHRFSPGPGSSHDHPYFVTAFDLAEGDQGTREDDVRIDQVLLLPGDQMTYAYDFGDGWEHVITLESITPLVPGEEAPTCLAGERACPPEDVGGVHGHHELAAWLRAGAPEDDVPSPFEGAQHAHDWLPDGYDPDAFDASEATEAMRQWLIGAHLPWYRLPPPLAELLKGLRGQGWFLATEWLAALGVREPVHLDDDDVRRASRPWLAVLGAVGTETRLTAAGYLPPAVVEQIATAAGITDWWIGKANREDHTYPVAILRENAQALGLLRNAKGTLSPTGRARTGAGDPTRLVATVLERLPLGKQLEGEAGWFLLLGLAAGESESPLHRGVADLLTDRGWRMQGGSGVSVADARRACRGTYDVLEAMGGGRRDIDHRLVSRLARASLFGVAEDT